MSLDVQLERLERHYDKSVKSYDFIELLELAHTLRVLAELLDEGDDKTGRDFKVLTPHKKIRRLIKKEDHIFMHLPEPITTYSVGPQGEARPQLFYSSRF
ncbi:MAG: hypothetical protein U5K69_06055 [Balneolaceae bacterium]|nr:hypothetical protein [Balneolaceae bacterium]